MPVFKDKQKMEEMFAEIWTKMLNETEFGQELKKKTISILFVINDPEVAMYVDENGLLLGEEARKKDPVVTMKMSADNVHKYWLDKLNVPKALALRQIKAKGPVGVLLQLNPLLKPGKALYPEYCQKYDLPVEI